MYKVLTSLLVAVIICTSMYIGYLIGVQTNVLQQSTLEKDIKNGALTVER